MEATVKHLEAVYPFNKYEKVRSVFAAVHGIDNLAGICFFPTRSGDAVLGNYTNGFDIVLVKWTSTPAGPISFFRDTDYLAAAATIAAPTSPSADDLKTNLMDIENLSGWDQLRLYNDSGEFEYSFIDRQTFEYLASSTAFYLGGVATGFKSGFPERGLLLSRAFITMQGGSAGNNYQRFRALRLAPYPEPPIPTDAAGRASIAYYVAPPCPPYWYDSGRATATGTGSGGGSSAPGPTPIMFSTEQLTDPPTNPDDCNPVVNNINKVELHQQLREAGLISKEPPPVYKMRLWPWIILIIIILLTAIIGMVEIIRGDTFFGKIG